MSLQGLKQTKRNAEYMQYKTHKTRCKEWDKDELVLARRTFEQIIRSFSPLY